MITCVVPQLPHMPRQWCCRYIQSRRTAWATGHACSQGVLPVAVHSTSVPFYGRHLRTWVNTRIVGF